MTEPGRGPAATPSGWARARVAYRALVGEDDPARSVRSAVDVTDLRPRPNLSGWSRPADGCSVLLAGPDDLIELRRVVERALGVETWPGHHPDGRLDPATTWTATIPLRHPGPALALLLSMEGLIEDRSPWRRWRTAVETIAPQVTALDTLTVQAALVDVSD